MLFESSLMLAARWLVPKMVKNGLNSPQRTWGAICGVTLAPQPLTEPTLLKPADLTQPTETPKPRQSPHLNALLRLLEPRGIE
jgi:hypothetical protein